VKFSQSRDGFEVGVEIPDDSSIDSVVEAFKSFLLAVGFHPNTVNEALPEEDEFFALTEKGRDFVLMERELFE